MKIVRIGKNELVNKLRENREKHHEHVKKAEKGYLKAVKEDLEQLLQIVNDGKIPNFRSLYKLQQPINKIEEYDIALQMLDMSTDDIIELTQDDFKKYVLDKWDWTADLIASNTKYI